MGSNWADWDEERSVVSDAADIHLDFEEEKSLLFFTPYDSGPVVVSQPFPFTRGMPLSAVTGETCADSVTIQNLTDKPVQLWSIRIISSIPKDSYMLSLMKPPSRDSDEDSIRSFCGASFLEDRMLQPRQTLTVWLSCKPVSIGMHNAVVHFDVGDEKIERLAFILAEDEISRSLASGNPYNRAPRKKGFTVDRYVHGTRPARTNVREYRFRLPPFNIPSDVREMIESNRVPDVITEGLSIRNYARYFSVLLVMEEIHLEEEMKTYDMEYVTMRRRGNHFLSLEVPGLAEKRPSLVCGDFIFAKLASEVADIRSEPYQGYIHRVEAEEIYLKFAPELHQRHRDDDHYSVRFTYNRINMRRMYQAVHEAETLGPDVLFPSESCTGREIRAAPFKPFSQDLNEEQRFAVGKILGCRGLPPYVIHGPPGTGKTLTLVESILQIYRDKRKNARILACAASNSAADHILEKLIGEDAGIPESKIFRLNASSRQYEDVKPEFIGFCFCEDMVFKCPPSGALLRYKIIISTYMSTSLLYAEGIRRGHFTHIILDEAGQASEPEMMIPLANLCHRQTVVILAGDPMQLGPVVYSKSADSYGLGRSYLDRLFECELYQHGDRNYVTKLIRNYRCHPAILDLPSRLFYNSELVASKVKDDSTIYELLDLPNQAFPVLFVGIQGCDEREGNNPSWFNRTEASKVVEFIRKIKRYTDLTESDIGIITPYRQQVLKLKKALDNLEMPDVKVGSVEQFQGQEREVIIVSTVRSTVVHNEFDRVFNLGFLSNPRRFNVAITRARSLLIIVGNPNILTKDPNWDKLLRHCADNNSYEGCPLPPVEIYDQAPYGTKDGNLGEYCNDAEWDEYIPEQHPDRTEWSDNPHPYSDGVAWGEDYESLPAQHTDKTEWNGKPDLYSDDVTLGEDNEQHEAKRHGVNEDHAQYCDDNEWQEDHNRYAEENVWEDQQPRLDSNNVPPDDGSRPSRKEQGWVGTRGGHNHHSGEIAQADGYYKPKLYNNDVEWE